MFQYILVYESDMPSSREKHDHPSQSLFDDSQSLTLENYSFKNAYHGQQSIQADDLYEAITQSQAKLEQYEHEQVVSLPILEPKEEEDRTDHCFLNVRQVKPSSSLLALFTPDQSHQAQEFYKKLLAENVENPRLIDSGRLPRLNKEQRMKEQANKNLNEAINLDPPKEINKITQTVEEHFSHLFVFVMGEEDDDCLGRGPKEVFRTEFEVRRLQ